MLTERAPFFRIRLLVYVWICALLTTISAHAAVDCTSFIDTTGDIRWRQVKKEIDKVHFLSGTTADLPDCPGGDKCDLPAFLLGGDHVMVSGSAYEPVHKKDLLCGVYISPKGELTYGWLDNGMFTGGGNAGTLIDDPKIYGDWSDGAQQHVKISRGDDGGYVLVEGDASVGSPDSPRTGEISGAAFIGGVGEVAGYSDSHYDGSAPPANEPVVEDGCRVRFRFTGYYLLVDDNDSCGGQGVSFDGVYVKTLTK